MGGREGLATLGQQLLREATGLASSEQVPEGKVPAHPMAYLGTPKRKQQRILGQEEAARDGRGGYTAWDTKSTLFLSLGGTTSPEGTDWSPQEEATPSLGGHLTAAGTGARSRGAAVVVGEVV
ncbi:hypothetical protein CSOJ01_08092 [Colletotrichum sojae]|uniref:Uncharacterized protein n=1 Tax=Colletotrichum sojae TaxID=2175907 RepID=A0A8H6J729_9PEZI|nr:hypothetical protein CSOJ01_08092 [Colletotrichum sojae]